MLNRDSPLAALLNGPMRPGRVEWIGLRPARGAAMLVVERVVLDSVSGLAGDRYAGRSGNRQVTLIGREDLAAIASYLGRDDVAPELVRRNIVTSGINLLALKGKRFWLGSALLEMTGDCHPCSQMEVNLGPGGYNAVRHHGGITARVVEDGEVAIGESVCVVSTEV